MNMFGPDGLVVYLNLASDYDPEDDDPSVPVTFGGTYTVEVRLSDLTCSSCGDPHDPVESAAARWLAANKVLNDGLCADCTSSD